MPPGCFGLNFKNSRQNPVEFCKRICYTIATAICCSQRRVSTSVVHRLPKPRRRVRFPYPAPENSPWILNGFRGCSLYSCGFPRIPQLTVVPHAAAELFYAELHTQLHTAITTGKPSKNQPGLRPAGFLFADECRWLCRWCGKVILSGQKSSDDRAKAEPPTADANRIKGGRPNGQQRFSNAQNGIVKIAYFRYHFGRGITRLCLFRLRVIIRKSKLEVQEVFIWED